MKKLNDEYQCAINLVIDLIGGKWKVLILWNLNGETKRFSELLRSMPSVTRKVLAQQLRELEEHGLVTRKTYEAAPPKVEYSTTDMGKKLQRTLNEMCLWGDEYAEKHQIEMKECWTGNEAAAE
ncbi:winged helix-turn-helix transcriptional regulator [Bacillus sp. SJS]|uniref:winged helix-turn-helix transcriptional regulator n=1 Tax=Bacillus sp. SJS TaxID=1423321 RepID=UPI0004DD7B41|nr:helix-turn-helix domain-containing protein [Bacillus sp. SJS]KZZ83319.1 ArsR family transcriptional regulator [Bacillus sp. SJS]